MNGIIIAGGKATRLNGISKGLIRINSKPIIEHLIETIQAYCDKIIIVANDHSYHYLNTVEIISDKVKDIGPMGGIYTGLNYSNSIQNIILSCDMPYLSNEIIEKLIENKHKGEILVAKLEKDIHPLCAIYSKTILPIIETHIQNQKYKLKDLLSQVNTYFVEFTINESKFFTNINTQQDLNQILQNDKS